MNSTGQGGQRRFRHWKRCWSNIPTTVKRSHWWHFQRNAGNLARREITARRLAALEPENPEVRALLNKWRPRDRNSVTSIGAVALMEELRVGFLMTGAQVTERHDDANKTCSGCGGLVVGDGGEHQIEPNIRRCCQFIGRRRALNS